MGTTFIIKPKMLTTCDSSSLPFSGKAFGNAGVTSLHHQWHFEKIDRLLLSSLGNHCMRLHELLLGILTQLKPVTRSVRSLLQHMSPAKASEQLCLATAAGTYCQPVCAVCIDTWYAVVDGRPM